MRLLMVAPPGAGKGTQAALLSAHYGIAHLSSGELFRQEIAADTEIGVRAAAYLANGDLVPDEFVLEVLREKVLLAAKQGGYVLDGFPRTRGQAEEAYRVAREVSGIELQAVIHLAVGRDELRRRLLARAVAQGRTDDTEETIAHRLYVYDELTVPMLDFYKVRGLIVDVDGDQPVDAVFADIVVAVDHLATGLV